MAATLVAAGIPTVAVLIGILINSRRLNDFPRSFDQGFAATNHHLDDLKEALMADLARFEQVLDARLKRIEERR